MPTEPRLTGPDDMQSQPSADAPAAEPTADSRGPAWLSSLPEQFRNDEVLAAYSDPADVTRDLREYAALRSGVPESPKSYDLRVPDGAEPNQGMVEGLQTAMHQARLTTSQADQLVEAYGRIMASEFEGQKKSNLAVLEKAYGAETPTKVKQANYVLRKVLGSEAARAALSDLDQTGMGNRAWLITLLSGLYPAVSEDSWTPSQRAGASGPKDVAQILYGKGAR